MIVQRPPAIRLGPNKRAAMAATVLACGPAAELVKPSSDGIFCPVTLSSEGARKFARPRTSPPGPGSLSL